MKKILLVLTLFTSGNILSMPSWSDSYPFDRIFTSPEQRKILDSTRANDGSSENKIADADPVGDTPPVKRFLLSGILIRDDGKHTVWVNGQSDISRPVRTSQLVVSPPNNYSKKVRLSTERKSNTAKPGQVWLVDTNEVKESYKFKKTENNDGIAANKKTGNTVKSD